MSHDRVIPWPTPWANICRAARRYACSTAILAGSRAGCPCYGLRAMITVRRANASLRFEGLRKYGVIREIRGKGFLRGVELVEDVATKKPFLPDRKLGHALRKTSLRNGLIMRVDADGFAVAPALIAERTDIDEMYALVEKSLVDALDLVCKTRDAAGGEAARGQSCPGGASRSPP